MNPNNKNANPPIKADPKTNKPPEKKPVLPRPGQRKIVLRFSPYAWAKLLFFRDRGQTEISGFGITPMEDLLYVEDLITVRQETSLASISLDDGAVADFFDTQVDAGLQPMQFARIWIHTHPGDSPQPSCTDEETFERVFGSCQYAVMVIVARGGKSYARLRFNVGPGGDLLIPVEVDFAGKFRGSNGQAWEEEYKANIKPAPFGADDWSLADFGHGLSRGNALLGLDDLAVSDLASMEEADRDYVLGELGCLGIMDAFQEEAIR